MESAQLRNALRAPAQMPIVQHLVCWRKKGAVAQIPASPTTFVLPISQHGTLTFANGFPPI